MLPLNGTTPCSMRTTSGDDSGRILQYHEYPRTSNIPRVEFFGRILGKGTIHFPPYEELCRFSSWGASKILADFSSIAVM